MNALVRWARSIAIGSLALAACDQAPTDVPSPAPRFSGVERSVQESLYDMSDVHFVFGCSDNGEVLPPGEGELVAMEGKIYERDTLLHDANGEYHVVIFTMPVGLRGVGVTSGEEFRVSERDQEVANQKLDGGSGSYRHERKLVGTTTGRTFWTVYTGFYRADTEGNLVVTRTSSTILCRPSRTS